MLNLLADGDFTATINVENATPHQVFELVVDWDRFYQNRISLQFACGHGYVDDEDADGSD